MDSSGGLYVADYSNSRVLFYPSGSITATRVYGQGNSFTSGTQNNGGISANSLNLPRAVALDSSGNLYVADYANTTGALLPLREQFTASRVYGQGGSFTSVNGGTSADGLDAPWAVALDGNKFNLYVADPGNNRVLFYPSGSTTAMRVYGQAGSFASSSPNNGGITANSLSFPEGVAVDGSGNLPKSSCAASCSMSCPEAFPASAISASSPTADEPACCLSAALCSTRLLQGKHLASRRPR